MVANIARIRAQRLIDSSADLYARVKRLDEGAFEDGTYRKARPGH